MAAARNRAGRRGTGHGSLRVITRRRLEAHWLANRLGGKRPACSSRGEGPGLFGGLKSNLHTVADGVEARLADVGARLSSPWRGEESWVGLSSAEFTFWPNSPDGLSGGPE